MTDYIVTDVLDFPLLRPYCRFLYGHNGMIAGGAFKSIFSADKPKDLDVFFENQEDLKSAICGTFTDKDLYEPAYETAKVTAFREKSSGIVVELIGGVYGKPKNLLNVFDFTITKFALFRVKEPSSDGESSEDVIRYKCIYHHQYFEHLMQRRVVIDDKIPFPASTFERMLRYASRSYMPCRETKIKILKAINELTDIGDVSASLYDGLD